MPTKRVSKLTWPTTQTVHDFFHCLLIRNNCFNQFSLSSMKAHHVVCICKTAGCCKAAHWTLHIIPGKKTQDLSISQELTSVIHYICKTAGCCKAHILSRTDKDTQEHWSFPLLIPCFYTPFQRLSLPLLLSIPNCQIHHLFIVYLHCYHLEFVMKDNFFPSNWCFTLTTKMC